jgi:hypothetical protein
LKPMSYTEQVQGSLFSWKTSGHLYHAMNECQVANLHEACPCKLATWHSFIAWYKCPEVFHENKLPCTCSVYDIGFKVLFICQVANFHGQASDAYAYVWMVQCS